MREIDNNQVYNHPDQYRDDGGPHCHSPQSPYNYSDKTCYDGSNPEAHQFYAPLDPLAGRVIRPSSRAMIMFELRGLSPFEVNYMPGGKNFPDLRGGPVPYPFDKDVESSQPPDDFFILGGSNLENRGRISATDEEVKNVLPNWNGWPEIRVFPGQVLEIEWVHIRFRLTRGFRAFITRDGWNPKMRITRAQLEPTPFYEQLNQAVPFYQYRNDLQPQLTHQITLPIAKRGHHIILLLWLIADESVAEYQAFDLNFGLN